MKSKFAHAITLFIILTLIAIPVSARFGSQSLDGQPPKIDISKLSRGENNLSVEEVAPANPKTGVVNAEGKSIYMVRLQDPPLAAYKGGIEGLAATNPSVLGQQKLNVDSPASQAYLAYLADRHKAMVGSMDKLLNRPVEVVYNYVSANNGMAIYLTPSEAAQIQQLPGVIYVEPDSEQELHTDAGPEWIGALSIWDGSETGGLPGTMGEGIIVGVIDTGINPSNPSFAEVGGDGYVFSNPKGHFVGVCDPSNPSYDPTFPCNNKLIGAWGYSTVNGGDPRDYDGHGSHTASTAAGNFVDAEVVGPTLTITRSISGVAPHANLIAYAACCTNSALSAAIDQIILDSVDVVNYSIGSVGCTATPDPWADFDSAGYLNAREAGIFVATSAGNCGPGDFTVGSPADVPWVTSVGATTHNRELVNALIDMAGGNTPPPGDIYGKSFTSGYGPAEIVYAGDFGDALCLNPFPADTFDGQIVVCDRGMNGRVEKGSNVKAGGAGGYILANDAASGESLNGDAHELPAVHITYDDGVRLKDWLADGGTSHTGTIMGTQVQEDPAFADILASFSSRGGNKALADILVPSVTAPGVDILAALGTGDSIEWGFESGTSMASPHTAGAGALLMSLHPDWTPAEVQSALMTTAYEDILNDDGVTPATTFQRGSGRVDLTKAGRVGLVLDETIAHYWESDPSSGGDPKTLNLASMADASCFQNCEWTRTFKSTMPYSATFQITASAEDPGVDISLSDSEVTVAAGDSFSLDVMVDVVNASPDEWHFGEVVLSDVDGMLPVQHLPIAVFSTSSTDMAVFTKTTSDQEVMVGSTVSYTLALQNTATVSTTFMVTDTVPSGAVYVDGSATGGLVYDATDKQLTWEGELGPSGIDISEADITGYLALADFGSTPYQLPTDADDGGLWITGLDFYYHGDHYTNAIWSVNGTLEAGTASGVTASAGNQDLPDPAQPNNLLAPWWRDLNLTDAGNWYLDTLSDGTNTYTVFEWNAVPIFGNTAITATFQIWIQDGTDSIWFTYADTPMLGPDNVATVGAEDAFGVAGTSYYYNGTGTLPGNTTDLAVEYFNSPPQIFTWDAVLTGEGPESGVTNVAYASDGTLDYAAFVHTVVDWFKVYFPAIYNQ